MSQLSITNVIRWCWRKAAGLRLRIVATCIVGVARVVAGLLFVWVSKSLVDAATSATPDRSLVAMSVALVALMVAELLLSLVTQYLITINEVAMKINLRAAIYDHLLITRWRNMPGMHTGDLLNRLTEDVRVIPEAVCSKLTDMVVMAVQLAGAFGLLLYMSPRLALCIIAIMPLFVILSRLYMRRTRTITSEIRRTDSDIQTDMQEGLQHHDVVQTFESESMMSRRLHSLHDSLYSATMRRMRIGITARALVRTGFIACYLTAFVWSIWHLRDGVITFGTMTAFLQLVGRIQMPLQNLAQLIPGLVNAISSVDRLDQIESIPAEDRTHRQWLTTPVGIKVSNLTFAYPGSDAPVFDNFSYDFAPGSKTVIMGRTGIGKSTLVKLLLSLLSHDSGTITLYNDRTSVDVSAATRCNMVYVPQGNSLLSGTIRQNLLLADPDADDQRLAEALHTAAADFVFSLPDGLDTRCGELGHGLSEGQAQRIAIARALLRQGAVLLLDEFNSALDAETARILMQRLSATCTDRTIIYISHRPDVEAFSAAVLRL